MENELVTIDSTLLLKYTPSVQAAYAEGYLLPSTDPRVLRIKHILTSLIKATTLATPLPLKLTVLDYSDANASMVHLRKNEEPEFPEGITAMIMTTGFIADYSNDSVLAAVLGHELGHDVLDNHDTPEGQKAADKFGINLAIKAGYSVKDLIERFLPEFSRTMRDDSNFPSRYKGLKATIDNLKTKVLTSQVA